MKMQAPGNTQEQKGQFGLPSSRRLFGPMKSRLTCSKMIGRKYYGKGKEGLMIQAYHKICTCWRQCYGMGMRGCQWNEVIGVY